MIGIINWCNANQGFVSAILATASLLASVTAIFVSTSTFRKQLKSERSVSERQEDLQRRQIKVDTYPYRLECWKNLYELKYNIELLKTVFQIANLYKSDFLNLSQRYSNLGLNYRYISLVLEQSKSIFPVKTWNKIEEINKNFTIINEHFAKFKMYSEILTYEEQKEREEEKYTNLKEVETSITKILENIYTVIPQVDIDLCIADLHSWKGIYN